MPGMAQFLRQLPLFSSFSEEPLEKICATFGTIQLQAGQLLFSEGDPGEQAFIIESGQIEIFKRSDRSDVLLAVREQGEVIGEMSLIESRPRAASARARTASRLYAVSTGDFKDLLLQHPQTCWTVLQIITERYRATELLLRQNEKMAQLGTLASGLAHELNNPAAALQRSGEQLTAGIQDLQSATAPLYKEGVLPQQAGLLLELQQLAAERLQAQAVGSPLELSDREMALEAWLDQREIPEAWSLASPLAQLDCTPERLQNLSRSLNPAQLAALLTWWTNYHQQLALSQEVVQSARRISEIVSALKGYVFLDQVVFDQPVDLRAGLENTLELLRGRILPGVQVRLDWGTNLPQPNGDARELNQVWTHLIENSLDALSGSGTLVLRTRAEPGWAVVEIEDDGPGIPPALLERVFEPFFTTKPPGQGEGVGLSIAYHIIQKHGGQIRLESQPGRTCVRVCLPLPRRDGGGRQ